LLPRPDKPFYFILNLEETSVSPNVCDVEGLPMQNPCVHYKRARGQHQPVFASIMTSDLPAKADLFVRMSKDASKHVNKLP
jgi:hypothetical protein